METLRKPFEGIYNIVRFNWHFYVLALSAMLAMLLAGLVIWPAFAFPAVILCLLIALPLLCSLLVSWYVYDCSELYALRWLDQAIQAPRGIVNIHAGFDESSALLQHKFPEASLRVFDFYDPKKHTEVSIRRARKAYPAFPGTHAIGTDALPLEDGSVDVVFLILAAHEIRDKQERLAFFRELRRVLKPQGKIVVTEHLRDLPNFLAYTIGFFHFQPEGRWKAAFRDSGFRMAQRFTITPFITTFILSKHDPAS